MSEETEAAAMGQRVKEAIKRSGKSQAYVAQQLGMPASQLSRLLKEGRNLRVPLLARIAGVCGLPPERLVLPTVLEREPEEDVVNFLMDTPRLTEASNEELVREVARRLSKR